ncbi:YiiX/YebB-like N1pC/P60 family cysteine hydrolase [Bacillus sp. JJ1532]|uniref:YiiX/YebB-like N1pC/P60 family cysteine hydrolase n=1 Tax=Bacillus sp. JJ1532 TaxID=3122958 RepID=UPI002FFF1419
MKLKPILAILLSSILIMSPLKGNAQSNEVNKEVLSVIESKIQEIDSLLLSSPDKVQCYEKCTQAEIEKQKETFLDQVNNIHVEIEEYFNSLDESVQKYEFEELVEKLDELDLEANRVQGEEEVSESVLTEGTDGFNSLSATTYWRYGDILYYGIGSDNAAGEPSFTGHTAVLSTTDYYVIEASRTSSSGNKVFHWNRDKLWKGASGIKQYKVTTLFGTNATAAERKKAVTFGLNQRGEPYSLKTALWNNNYWYCSKLTMRQWYDAGYDLRGARGLHWSGFLLVIPFDIRIDANTRLIKDWGRSLPSKI